MCASILREIWNVWAAQTGGKDVADYEELMAAIETLLAAGDPLASLKVIPQTDYADWVVTTPAERTHVALPASLPFTATITPPAGTAAGVYTFTLGLVGTPASGAPVSLANQQVVVTVGQEPGLPDLAVMVDDNGAARVMAGELGRSG